MSRESSSWLNQFCWQGFTDQRGKMWHFDKRFQGDHPNHYPGAIPIEDVRERLFNWKAEGWTPMASALPDEIMHLAADLKENPQDHEAATLLANLVSEMSVDRGRKSIVRTDTGAMLGVFKSGYQIHDYDEWLLNNVATILDDTLSIGSAGLLKGGAQAWVSIEVPDNITTPEGVEFRPRLLSSTSLDGSLATSYSRVSTMVVCDNTLAAGLAERGPKMKFKHTKNSALRIQDARDALAIVHSIANDFMTEVAELTSVKVSDGDWAKFLDSLVPVPEDEGRGQTMAEAKQADLNKLWNNDDRVTPWKNTAFGVVQAVNTYSHHFASVRGVDREERNMENAVLGKYDTLDADTLSKLAAVLA